MRFPHGLIFKCGRKTSKTDELVENVARLLEPLKRQNHCFNPLNLLHKNPHFRQKFKTKERNNADFYRIPLRIKKR